MADDRDKPAAQEASRADAGLEDARWLIDLITTVQVQAEGAGRPEVASILSDALDAARRHVATVGGRPARSN